MFEAIWKNNVSLIYEEHCPLKCFLTKFAFQSVTIAFILKAALLKCNSYSLNVTYKQGKHLTQLPGFHVDKQKLPSKPGPDWGQVLGQGISGHWERQVLPFTSSTKSQILPLPEHPHCCDFTYARFKIGILAGILQFPQKSILSAFPSASHPTPYQTWRVLQLQA